MTNTTEFQSELSAIQSIPLDAVKKPLMPIRQYIYEAEFLHRWSQADRPLLEKAGLDLSLLDAILNRAGALREAESLWSLERFSREDAQKEWEEQSPAAYALRDKLLRDMRFAFRRDDALLARVADIADGAGHVDMLQDLNDLALLGRTQLVALAGLGVDEALLDQAAALADQLTTLLASAAGERKEGNSARQLRDQAYTHLKAAVDEVRDFGQYVFWDNAIRRDGYFSDYTRRANARSQRNRAEANKTGEVTTDA